ncbi:MAG TPA: hypothetical protein VGG45_17180 [Terracidiphilus sp.]|jgi:hypothetical protein
MTKIFLFFALALSVSSRVSYAAHITSDASLTLGTPVTAVSVGSTASNPWVLNPCSSQPFWQLVPDPWGVNSNAVGSIKMQYTGTGSIITTVALSNLDSTGVNAFPFVFYGSDPFGDHISGQALTFPVQLSSLTSLITDVNYTLSVTAPAPGDLDIGFDEWLIPTSTYTGGLGGALEIMVLPYFEFGWAPAGSFVGTFTETVIVNGTPTSMVFNEYSTGTGAGHEIIFFPKAGQISSGDVRLNLLDFMKAGAATGGLNSSWYLAGIDFGTEFGHAASAKYVLTTNKIEIEEDFTTPE